MMQSMADPRLPRMVVRMRQVDEQTASSRVQAARHELERAERVVAAETERSRKAIDKLARAGAGVDAGTAGRVALHERLRQGLRSDLDRHEARRRQAAELAGAASQRHGEAQDALARAHLARRAAETALRTAEEAERRKRVRREERAAEERAARGGKPGVKNASRGGEKAARRQVRKRKLTTRASLPSANLAARFPGGKSTRPGVDPSRRRD
jgi:hypothetical protein